MIRFRKILFISILFFKIAVPAIQAGDLLVWNNGNGRWGSPPCYVGTPHIESPPVMFGQSWPAIGIDDNSVGNHPPSMYRWTNPYQQTVQIQISGGVYLCIYNGGDSTWEFKVNDLLVSSGTVVNPGDGTGLGAANMMPFSDGTGGTAALNITLGVGEYVDLLTTGGNWTGVQMQVEVLTEGFSSYYDVREDWIDGLDQETNPNLPWTYRAIGRLNLPGCYVVVAPSNASPEEKARSDLVCDGNSDEVELTASLKGSKSGAEWLPGDYYLNDTVVLMPCIDSVIDAEGTYLHHQSATGDAIYIQGAVDCRYRFGTIETSSTGAAIRVQNPDAVSILMNIITFNSLIGHNQSGVGLYIDVREEGICTDRFDGLSISGFDTGILLGSGPLKTDTNWFFINSIRNCSTAIRELNTAGVDDSFYIVSIDTTLDNSVGIRTNAHADKFDVMMSDSSGVGTKAVILDSGSSQNVIEILPPMNNFTLEDNSGSFSNNTILSAGTHPFYYVNPPVLADFDWNNFVNIFDLNIFAQGWLSFDNDLLELRNDEIINFEDFSVFANEYLKVQIPE